MLRAMICAGALALAALTAAAVTAQEADEGSSTVSLYGGGGPTEIELKPPRLELLPTLIYMRDVINPAANAYWAQAGSLDPDGGDEVIGAPEYEEDWAEQLHRGAVLMEAGNGLHVAGRDRNGRCQERDNASCDAVWNYYAQELIDGGKMAIDAARAQDAVAAFDAGSLIYDACYGCHARYIPRPANSRYSADFPSDEELREKAGE
jgi:hypothetical protein